MNKKIIFSLIAISLSVFITLAFSNSVKADIDIPVPSDSSAFMVRFNQFLDYPYSVNGSSIFDSDLNYISGWNDLIFSVDSSYSICDFSYNSAFQYGLSFYDSLGNPVIGYTSSSSRFLGCSDNEPVFDQSISDRLSLKLNANPDAGVAFVFLYIMFDPSPYYDLSRSVYVPLYVDENGDKYRLNDDFTAYSTAVNGSCGSANNSSFSVFPSDNLCSSGVICSGQPYTDGTYYYWTCYGYGPGATSEDCRASVLVSTAQCGYLANTQYSDSSPPSGSNACLSGSVRDMLQLDDDSWLWYCEVSDDDFVPCSTFSDNPIVITPSLPSSPDIACGDILTGQGFANCISSVFAWLFLPHQDTIDEFFQLGSLIKTKIPFGYVYSFRDEINNLTSSSSSDFSIALTFNGDDQVPVVNSDTFDVLGSDFKSTYFRFIRAILWISFGVWVFTLGRKLFLNNRDS
jgi:hypothetical protein